MPTGIDESLIVLDKDPVQFEAQRLKNALACTPATHSKRIPAFQMMVDTQVKKAISKAESMLRDLENQK